MPTYAFFERWKSVPRDLDYLGEIHTSSHEYIWIISSQIICDSTIWLLRDTEQPLSLWFHFIFLHVIACVLQDYVPSPTPAPTTPRVSNMQAVEQCTKMLHLMYASQCEHCHGVLFLYAFKNEQKTHFLVVVNELMNPYIPLLFWNFWQATKNNTLSSKQNEQLHIIWIHAGMQRRWGSTSCPTPTSSSEHTGHSTKVRNSEYLDSHNWWAALG